MPDSRLPLNILRVRGITQANTVNQAASLNTGRALAAAGPSTSITTGSLNAQLGRTVAYVANSNTNTISVIDMSNFTKLMDIVVGTSPTTGPIALDISPNGNYLYAVNRIGTMTIINTSDNSIAGTIDLPTTPASSPSGIKVSLDGRYIYVVYNAAPVLSIINAMTQQVTGSISLPDSGFGIDITGDGRYAYVTLRDSNQVAVVDLKANLVMKLISGVPTPENITIWKSGSLAFVSGTCTNVISVINTNLAEAASETIPAYRRPAGIAISPTFGKVYAALSGSRQVEIIDMPNSTILPPIDIGQIRPEGIAITFDERFLVVANSGSGTASLVNLITNKVEASIPTGSGASYVAILEPERIGFRDMQ